MEICNSIHSCAGVFGAGSTRPDFPMRAKLTNCSTGVQIVDSLQEGAYKALNSAGNTAFASNTGEPSHVIQFKPNTLYAALRDRRDDPRAGVLQPRSSGRRHASGDAVRARLRAQLGQDIR